MGGIATSAGPTPDLDAMIEQLQSGSYIEARERNPFAGPMTLIEPGVASKAAAALAQQQSRIAALEAERDALAKDAARWRKARSRDVIGRFKFMAWSSEFGRYLDVTDDVADAAIDAARSKP